MDELYRWEYPLFDLELPLQDRMMQQGSVPYLTLDPAEIDAVKLSILWSGCEDSVSILTHAALHCHQPWSHRCWGFHHGRKVLESRQSFAWESRMGYDIPIISASRRQAVWNSSSSSTRLHCPSHCARPCRYLCEKQLLLKPWLKTSP